jgi:tRNA dimethylallyltransferase
MKLSRQGVLPVVAGGTGLYIKALLYGLFPLSRTDPRFRMTLKAEIERHGVGYLHERLRRCDPEAAGRIHPNDTYRIIRALEIFESTGKKLSNIQKKHGFTDEPFRTLKIGLHMEREELYARIDHRVDEMMEAGLLDEVKRLLDRGYGPELKSMQSIGYRHMAEMIEGRISLEEAMRTMKRDTRRYAKRQMTWFGADPEIKWVESSRTDDRTDKLIRLVSEFLSESPSV